VDDAPYRVVDASTLREPRVSEETDRNRIVGGEEPTLDPVTRAR
jgi:hypothetical protein